MNNRKIERILKNITKDIQGQEGYWQFKINDVILICVTDPRHNRMRVMSPIVEVNELNEELKDAALTANFHTALDVKYAISDNILWSVFMHPLKELTSTQFKDAVNQVYSANTTFGTFFSSSDLVFVGK